MFAIAVILLCDNETAYSQSLVSSLSGRVQIARLLDLASQRLDVQIVYEESDARAQFVWRDPKGLSDEQLWSLVNDTLVKDSLTTIRQGEAGAMRVVRLNQALQLARVEPAVYTSAGALGGAVEVPAGFQRRLVRFTHADHEGLQPLITTLLSPNGKFATVDNRTLLLSDLTTRLDRIQSILSGLDTPAAAPSEVRIPLQHLSAARLIAQVNTLQAARAEAGAAALQGTLSPLPDGASVMVIAPPESQDAWRRLIESLDTLEPVETRVYTPGLYALEDVESLLTRSLDATSNAGSGAGAASAPTAGPRIVTDELTGTLSVTATLDDHAKVEEILARLAAVPPEARRPVRTFVIENRNVTEVMDLLERLVDTGVLEPAGGGDQGGASGEAPSSRPARGAAEDDGEDRALSMTADERTNTLIVVGEARLLEQIERLLEDLDVQQPQVVIEVMLISLSDGESKDMGIELSGIIENGEQLIRLSSLFGLSSVSPELLTTAGLGGGGGTAVVLDPGDFAAVVRALKTINDGRSLSMPKVLVSNNETATFDSVLQEPFTTVNASDTVATTGFGGTQDAGTTITVSPQIAAGDHLVLDYSVSLSTFVGESSDPSTPPPRQQNSLSSLATIPDGYTIAVGGIEQLTEAEAVSKTPILGDVPVVGMLFRNTSKSASRSRFYVFIRATVLRARGFEDLKYLSDEDLAGVELDDGWPKNTPRIIR